MEGWRDGGMEEWRDGGMERWRDGGMEAWRKGKYRRGKGGGGRRSREKKERRKGSILHTNCALQVNASLTHSQAALYEKTRSYLVIHLVS